MIQLYFAISIHALLAECDHFNDKLFLEPIISIHALLAECDFARFGGLYDGLIFQSTHSSRSATYVDRISIAFMLISIHALLAECDLKVWAITNTARISIHALLAECDGITRQTTARKRNFNPRTPRLSLIHI